MTEPSPADGTSPQQEDTSPQQEGTSAKRDHRWTRPDLINLAGVIVALVAFTSPLAFHIYEHYFQDPHAAISTPVNGQVFATNQIAVKGTAGNIPPDSDLWLSASGPSDEVYPIAELQVNAGQWSVTEKRAYFRIGPGPQRLDVWMSPDTDDGEFVGYMQVNHTFGFFTRLSQFSGLCDPRRSCCVTRPVSCDWPACLSSGRADCGHVYCRRVAGLPAGQRVDRVDVDEAVAFPEGPGGLVGAVAG
jgi:hypothetical protein